MTLLSLDLQSESEHYNRGHNVGGNDVGGNDVGGEKENEDDNGCK